MKNFIKNSVRHLFWALFIAWNVFLIFVILGKKQPEVTKQKTEEALIIAPKKIAKKEQISIMETESAVFKFNEDKLESVELKKYTQNTELKKIIHSEPIEIFWQGDITPKQDAIWSITKKDNIIIMQSVNQGITFIKTFEFDKDYTIICKAYVKNNSKKPVTIQTYIKSSKKEYEKHQSLLFSGISTFDGEKIKNIKAHKIKCQHLPAQKQNAWCAFNEKYFLTALTSEECQQINIHDKHGLNSFFTISIANKAQTVEPKQESMANFNIYIGPKTLENLKNFGEKSKTQNIENTINYGWLFFLTKPLHYAFIFLIKSLSSVALAIIVLSVILKIITWPMTTRSHIAMKRMHELAPEMNQIRQRFKDNPTLMNNEILALYKKHKINPIGAFVPAIAQMLTLFPLYKVLSFSIELYNAPFTWISDLSAPDPTSILNLFGLLPFTAPDFLHIGAWPILMGITMLIQQIISSNITDKEQQIIQYSMPIFFTWIIASLPAGVVIYWTIMNILTILQILYIDFYDKKLYIIKK